MVRVWLRPALAAFSRQTAAPVALKASSQHLLIAQRDAAIQVRSFSSKKDKSHDKKKTLRDKFVDIDEDPTELPPDVQFLNKEMREQEDKFDPRLLASLEHGDLILDDELSDDSDDDDELVEEEEGDEIDQLQSLLEGRDSDDENDENDFLDDDDLEGLEDEDDDEESALTDAEWAAKYERQIARMESRNGMREVEDDRLYCELPNRDVALMLSTEGDLDGEGDDDDDEDDDEEWEQSDDEEEDQKDTAFKTWDQAAYYTPEMMNWMQPKEKRTPFVKGQDKPWKYFVRANHPDPVELAMDVDLLRLFISPTGRIRPRRFTGLTAKQQRQLARSVKISRQLALLPYLTRYPDPSPEQWRAMDEETMAKALADLENGEDEDDDDDDDEDWEMEEE